MAARDVAKTESSNAFIDAHHSFKVFREKMRKPRDNSKKIQSKISKGKRPMAKPEGNQAQASRSPLLVETRKTGLITPATKCKNTYETCTREAH